MFVNCMSYALDVENENINHFDLDLWYSHNTENIIREASKRLNRSSRLLDNEFSPLQKDEWLIAFFGIIPLRYDNYGDVEQIDYHFMKYENGTWMHRRCIGANITKVTGEVFVEFLALGYKPQFFAIKKVEE